MLPIWSGLEFCRLKGLFKACSLLTTMFSYSIFTVVVDTDVFFSMKGLRPFLESFTHCGNKKYLIIKMMMMMVMTTTITMIMTMMNDGVYVLQRLVILIYPYIFIIRKKYLNKRRQRYDLSCYLKREIQHGGETV